MDDCECIGRTYGIRWQAPWTIGIYDEQVPSFGGVLTLWMIVNGLGLVHAIPQRFGSVSKQSVMVTFDQNFRVGLRPSRLLFTAFNTSKLILVV